MNDFEQEIGNHDVDRPVPPIAREDPESDAIIQVQRNLAHQAALSVLNRVERLEENNQPETELDVEQNSCGWSDVELHQNPGLRPSARSLHVCELSKNRPA